MAKNKAKEEVADFSSGHTEEKMPVQELKGGFKSEQARKVAGFLLIVLSLVLLISFISFLFTWRADADLLNGPGSDAEPAANAMGLLGAKLGYIFINNGFGLAAFLLLPFTFLSGAYLLFDYRPFVLIRIAIHSIIFGVWLSLCLGFAFKNFESPLGGMFGYFGVKELNGSIGFIGTLIFLLAYAVVYSIVLLNFNPLSRIKLPDPKYRNRISEFFAAEPDVARTDVQKGQQVQPEIIEDEIDLTEILGEEKHAPIKDPSDLPPIYLKKKEEETAAETSRHEPIILATDDGFEIEDNTKIEDDVVAENMGERITHNGIDTVYDPTAELSGYRFPTLELLAEVTHHKHEIDMNEIETSKNLIIETLKNYNIGISKIKASVGPTVTLYEIIPAPGVKISKIKNLEDDIALSLAALGIRIIAPIPGKGTIGIEVPNKNPEMVPMRTLLASKKFQECDFQLPVVLGKTISNEIFIADLAKMPHLLMAGATGQGKSVGLNAILVSLLYKKHPAYIKFVLVDPKKVELTLFNKIERHFLAKLPGEDEAILTDNKKVINTLNSLCVEMDERYKLLQDAMVRNIVEYNGKFLARKLNPENSHRFLPYIVVVIDEVADLIMTAGKEIETPIARLAQLARAIGIHLILATQRPSVNVITGLIKANFPARAAFRVSSKIDSRTILDSNGADQLIGKGDMLYSAGTDMIRLQCPFVDTPEVERICDFIGEQRAYPTAYILPEVQDENDGGGDSFNPNERDELFEEAARVVVLNQIGSTSLIQRRLKLGYNRAGRLMDQLEDAGIVGPNAGSKAREVRYKTEHELEQYLNSM